MSGYGLVPDPAVLDVQRRMARAINLPVIWGTAANLEGRSLSIARAAGVPAIYTEYLGGGRCSAKGADAFYEGCLNVMGELEMLDREPPAGAVELVIEDPQPGSGHMQVQNPSPITGQFTPSVSLGQRVRPGEVLGHVSNISGSDVREIPCTQDGHVLAVRTYPRVHQDDSLIVIIEADPAAGD